MPVDSCLKRPPPKPQHFQPADLSYPSQLESTDADTGLDNQPVVDVDLDLRIDFGDTRLRLEEVLQLRPGSLVSLDQMVSDPAKIYVNDRLVAYGEVLTMDDRFCVRIIELIGG